MMDAPDIEVHFVPHGTEPGDGVGESGVPPTAVAHQNFLRTGKSKFCLPGVSVFGRSTIFSQLDNATILVVQVLLKKSREVQSLPAWEGLQVRKVSAYAATV